MSASTVLVYKYPTVKHVGKLTIPYPPWGLCSDKNGNVFVVTRGDSTLSYVYKYTHGGSKPIATLSDPGEAIGCAVDPMTGNLAVTNFVSPGSPYHGDVAIFPNASGSPTTYSDPNVTYYFLCAYDNEGNLFATATGVRFIDELPAGSSSFLEILLNKPVHNPASIQRHGNDLIVTDATGADTGPLPVYTIQVSGSAGNVLSSTFLYSRGDHNVGNAQYFTGRHNIIGPGLYRKTPQLLEWWRYPNGGKAEQSLRPRGEADLFGVTVSAAK